MDGIDATGFFEVLSGKTLPRTPLGELDYARIDRDNNLRSLMEAQAPVALDVIGEGAEGHATLSFARKEEIRVYQKAAGAVVGLTVQIDTRGELVKDTTPPPTGAAFVVVHSLDPRATERYWDNFEALSKEFEASERFKQAEELRKLAEFETYGRRYMDLSELSFSDGVTEEKWHIYQEVSEGIEGLSLEIDTLGEKAGRSRPPSAQAWAIVRAETPEARDAFFAALDPLLDELEQPEGDQND